MAGVISSTDFDYDPLEARKSYSPNELEVRGTPGGSKSKQGDASTSSSSDSSTGKNKTTLTPVEKTALMFGNSLSAVGAATASPSLVAAGALAGPLLSLAAGSIEKEIEAYKDGASAADVSIEAQKPPSEAFKSASLGFEKGKSLSLDKLNNKILNVQDPAVRSQLEALGLSDSQLDNKNSVFAITGGAGDKHLSYNYESKENGNRNGSVKLDASKDNFGVDFSKGGLGASGWVNYEDKEKNDSLLEGVKGEKYEKEIERRDSYESPEAFKTAEAIKSQLTALSNSGIGDLEAKEMLAKLGMAKTDAKVTDAKVNDLSAKFMAHLKAEGSESSMAYLAGRRHGAVKESLEVDDPSSILSQMQLLSSNTEASGKLGEITKDGDSTYTDTNGETKADASLINDYENEIQGLLDKNTESLHSLSNDEQKQFTESHKALEVKMAELTNKGNLSTAEKQMQNTFENYSAGIGENGEGSEYLRSEQEHLSNLLGENSTNTNPGASSADNKSINGKDVSVSQVGDTAGYYNDIFHEEKDDKLYQKQEDGSYKEIEKNTEDNLYHVKRGDSETLYGNGPLGVKQVVEGYKEGELPGADGVKPDRYHYNYTGQTDSTKEAHGHNHTLHTKDGQLQGITQKNATGGWQPPSLSEAEEALPVEAEPSVKKDIVMGLALERSNPGLYAALKKNQESLQNLKPGESMELAFERDGKQVNSKIANIDNEYYYDTNGNNLAGKLSDDAGEYILGKDADGNPQASQVEKFLHGWGSNNDYGRISKAEDGSIDKVFGRDIGGAFSEIKPDEKGLYSLTDNIKIQTQDFGVGPNGSLGIVSGNAKDGFSWGKTEAVRSGFAPGPERAFFSHKASGNEYFYGRDKGLIGVKTSEAKSMSNSAPKLKDSDYSSLAPAVKARMEESISKALIGYTNELQDGYTVELKTVIDEANEASDPIARQEQLLEIEHRWTSGMRRNDGIRQDSFDRRFKGMSQDIALLSGLNGSDNLTDSLETFKASRSGDDAPVTQAEFEKFKELHQSYENHLRDNWDSMKERGIDMDNFSVVNPNSLEYALNNYSSNSGLRLSSETMKQADDTIREQLGLPKDYEILFDASSSGSVVRADLDTDNQLIRFADVLDRQFIAEYEDGKLSNLQLEDLSGTRSSITGNAIEESNRSQLNLLMNVANFESKLSLEDESPGQHYLMYTNDKGQQTPIYDAGLVDRFTNLLNESQ